MGSLLLVVGLHGHTEMYSSVELCITGNLSLGSVGLHSSVQLCIAKGWFADVAVIGMMISFDGCCCQTPSLCRSVDRCATSASQEGEGDVLHRDLPY